MNRPLLLTTLTVLVAAGCGGNAGGLSSTGGGPSSTRVTSNTVAFDVETTGESLVSNLWITAPLEEVNAVLPSVLTALGFTLEPLDSAGTRLRSEPLVVNRRLAGQPVSTYFDCGRNPIGALNANVQSVQIYVDVVASGGEQGTQLQTRMEAVATPRATSGGTNRCITTGRFEQRIVADVQERIAAGRS